MSNKLNDKYKLILNDVELLMYYHKEFEVSNTQSFQKLLSLLEHIKEKINVKNEDEYNKIDSYLDKLKVFDAEIISG